MAAAWGMISSNPHGRENLKNVRTCVHTLCMHGPMNIAGCEWDQGNRDKCQKHGVSIAAIESVFHGVVAVFPDPAHSQGEERLIAIGKTDEGRHVFLAFTLRRHGTETFVRPISARYMHRKEVEHYEKAIAETDD